MEGGQGGRWGGGTKEQCGSNKRCTGFLALKNLTTGLIWLVTRVGGIGGGVGRWPMEGGQGGRWGWGHQRAVGSPFGPLKNRTTGLIWLVTRVGGWAEAWGGGPWRAGKGGDGGGGTREQCVSNSALLFAFGLNLST